MMTQSTSDETVAGEESSTGVLRFLQSGSRYLFPEEEFALRTGRVPGSSASQMALQRLSKAGRVALVQKMPAKWLIIPPEQIHFGAPPLDWWLDDLLRDHEPDYYLALLSAARFWGSSHYAIQRNAVMVSRPRRPLSLGKIGVDFVVKSGISSTPVEYERTRVARVRVSTREATLLDLIRHQSQVGGLEAIARIAHDFHSKMTANGVLAAVIGLGQVPATQRLGFVLEQLGHNRLTTTAANWLQKAKRNVQPLVTSSGEEASHRIVDSSWGIEYTATQLEIIKEVRGD